MPSSTTRRQSQSTASSPPSSPASGNSNPVEPKSEYLRHALEAQRAKQAAPAPISAPAPSEPKATTPATVTTKISDPWLDQAKEEQDTSKSTPPRRVRRPSEGMAVRKPAPRDHQAEMDKMKEALFSLNMKLELIREQNNELKDEVEQADRRIAELEQFEDENHDLRESNNRLELRMEEVFEEVVDLRERNAEILQIQEESVQNMEKQNTALQEAAEIILRMEQQKNTLAEENALLREQVTTLQTPTTEYKHSGLDGNTKRPTRAYSIDESRPSTSHFDSDYYSQPTSPHVKASKESLPSVTVSDRARDFLTLNRESKKSTQDLKKRMSEASVQMAKSSSGVPDVPLIPETYRESRAPVSQHPVRTPTRVRPSAHLSPDVQSSSGLTRNDQHLPRTPINQTDGLRGQFRSDSSLDTSSHSSRAGTNQIRSPLESRNLRSSHGSERSISTRRKQHQVPQSSSHEQLQPVSRSRPTDKAYPGVFEWDPPTPTHPADSISDLTTEPDRDLRGRWWKTVDGITSTGGAFVHASEQRAAHRRDPREEQNFLFNPAESDEAFLAKVNGHISRRRDR